MKTIPIYILFLVGIFLAVKSYIFEPDSGIGITTEKKDKGYSRWAKDKEIKTSLQESTSSEVDLVIDDIEHLLIQLQQKLDDLRNHNK